jgi:NADH:ubiquinone oxidoreductase subunit F (NADH-binding)
MTPDLVDLLEAAGLTGRGGAAFPTATKLRAARESKAALIVNACDGELDAAKDGWVVEHHLDELVTGAGLLASRNRRGGIRYAAHRGSDTAARLRAAGLDVIEAPDRYVSSEETALISLAQGGLARPMTKRQPFVRGGRDSAGRKISPTLVVNAETAWRVAQIVANGPAWFRSFGTPEEPGPRLAAVSGYVHAPAVIQSQAGTPISSLVDAAGGTASDAEAVLVGGLGGVFLSASDAWRVPWSTPALARFGGSVGPGVIHVLDPRECPIWTVDRILTYAAGESAGQCGPCMFGLPALATQWRALGTHPSRSGHDAVLDRAGLLPNRGACRFPDGVARFAESALRVFGDHLRDHVTSRCPFPTRMVADVH